MSQRMTQQERILLTFIVCGIIVLVIRNVALALNGGAFNG